MYMEGGGEARGKVLALGSVPTVTSVCRATSQWDGEHKVCWSMGTHTQVIDVLSRKTVLIVDRVAESRRME